MIEIFYKRFFVVCILFSGCLNLAAEESIFSFVNLFMGTAGDHGQVTPAACSPFGMVSPCPDSSPRQHAGYDYNVTKTSGISLNRLSGVGCSGCGGNLNIRSIPFGMEWNRVPSTERAIPGFYTVALDNGDKVRLTATENVALEEYNFGYNSDHSLYIDALSSFTSAETDYICTSDSSIQGIILGTNTCGNGHYQLAFHLSCNHPFIFKKLGNGRFCLNFDGIESVEVRIGVSSFSPLEAKKEVEKCHSLSFDEIQKKVSEEWNDILSRIEVKSNNEEWKTIFYTSLYRLCLSPHEVARKGSFYRGTDGNIHLAEHNIYGSWSLWDTYRTKFTFLGLICPERSQYIARSIIDLYKQNKAGWSTDYEPTPTVRSEHAGILLLDYYKRGINGINLSDAYPGLIKEARNLILKSPDQKIEAVGDWLALSEIAEILKDYATAKNFRTMSDSLFETVWKKEFMKIDSSYTMMGGNGLYQGTRWQYRWAAPWYIDKMAEWASYESLAGQLCLFFDNNLFNQGNEPDIHTPYLFNRLERKDLTSKIIHKLLTDDSMKHIYGGNAEYKIPYIGRAFRNAPNGYMPEMDEDDGTMSAWYAFSCMGIYPLIIGSDEYEVTTPLFEEVVLHLPEGKIFRIVNKQKKYNSKYSISLNGHKLNRTFIKQQEIMDGGELVIN